MKLSKMPTQVRHAAARFFGAALLLLPSVVHPSTAENTEIANIAAVTYQDAGDNPQPAVTATATVTVIHPPGVATRSSRPSQAISDGASSPLVTLRRAGARPRSDR
jgi:hypothetical protein